MNAQERAAIQNYMAAFGQALEAHGIPYSEQQINADAALREALAEQQTERTQDAKRNVVGLAEQPKQEPVAWASFDNAYSKACNSSNPQDWMEAALLAQQIRTAPVTVTTPDVCGEVCARAKLCYGCNKDLEEGWKDK